MPGGKGQITGAEGNTFSSTNQPKNRRKSTKFLTQLLIKGLNGKKEIVISGFDVETGKPATIRVPMPTRENIIQALLRKAAKGDVTAVKEIFDRVEGRTKQPVELTGKDGQPIQTENNSVVIYLPSNKRGPVITDETGN